MTKIDGSRTSARKVFQGRWFWIILALVLLGGVTAFLISAEDTVDVGRTKAPPPAQLISIETALVSSERVEVAAFAEVRPRWSAELRAAVSGRVTTVLDSALTGERVDVGTTLITIEDSRYVAELAAAKLALKEAELALWNAKNANLVARKDFERARKRAPNDLALKLPQLDIAKSSVAAAKARVATTRRQLSDATISAPFAGFVTKRFVSPGQSVNVGDRLVKLVDSANFELTVQLGRNDWRLLEKPIAGLSAKVTDQSGVTIAQASIRQGGGFLDETTRQYKVFLEIGENHARRVLSGDFVRVILPGITAPAALNIPASALTQEGFVWHVDEANRLQRFTPKVLFRRQGRVVVTTPDGARKWRIAATPLASFFARTGRSHADG